MLLYLVVLSGVLGVVVVVLEYGGDLNVRNDDGRTSLMFACARKLEESECLYIVEMFVSCGINVEVCDLNGLMVLYIVCKCGNDVVVEVLF